jgi:hypothetical protein
MKGCTRIALVAGCCALLVPATAAAKVKQVPTEIALVADGSGLLQGHLTSPIKGCLRDRVVTLAALGADAFQTIASTRDGAFAIAIADVPAEISVVRVTVAATTFGSRTCEQDAVVITFDEATLSGGAGDGAFRGVLSSSIDACEPGRTISLYEISSDPVFVGWNVTDETGAWTIAQAGGSYEARTEATFSGDGDAFTSCEALVSPAWFYEELPESD